MKPHKHAELIKAWADGAQIQYKTKWNPTQDWNDNHGTPSWADDIEYRIKPNMVKYRAVLMITLTNIKYVTACNDPESSGIVEASNSFIKWLGDWQEVEV